MQNRHEKPCSRVTTSFLRGSLGLSLEIEALYQLLATPRKVPKSTIKGVFLLRMYVLSSTATSSYPYAYLKSTQCITMHTQHVTAFLKWKHPALEPKATKFRLYDPHNMNESEILSILSSPSKVSRLLGSTSEPSQSGNRGWSLKSQHTLM